MKTSEEGRQKQISFLAWMFAQRTDNMSKSFPHKDRIRRLETRNGRVSKNDRFLQVTCWFPVYYVDWCRWTRELTEVGRLSILPVRSGHASEFTQCSCPLMSEHPYSHSYMSFPHPSCQVPHACEETFAVHLRHDR